MIRGVIPDCGARKCNTKFTYVSCDTWQDTGEPTIVAARNSRLGWVSIDNVECAVDEIDLKECALRMGVRVISCFQSDTMLSEDT